MTEYEFEQLKVDDQVSLYGKQYRFLYHDDGAYIGQIISKKGKHTINITWGTMEALKRGWTT